MTGTRRLNTIALLLGLAGVAIVGWGAYAFANPVVVVRWSTATEFETAGFAVYRSSDPDGPFEKISGEMIPAVDNPVSGGDYEFADQDVIPGRTYYYMLEEIEVSGETNQEGPVISKANRRGLIEGALGAFLIAASVALARSSPRNRAAGTG